MNINILKPIGIVILIIALGLTSWYIKREINWYFGYDSNVKELTTPLEDRIEALEKRITILEQRNK